MINKKTFLFDYLTDAYKYKIGATPQNSKYRLGSFADDAPLYDGEPDIPYYSQIFIRETNQMWSCNQFWLNDVERQADTDLTTEIAERTAADTLLQGQIDSINVTTEALTASAEAETTAREEKDEELAEVLANQQAALTALGLEVDGLAGKLITMETYRSIKPKEFKVYYVARNDEDKAKMKCWRIYLRTQLIGEFETNGALTLPKFPMRFPFRFV